MKDGFYWLRQEGYAWEVVEVHDNGTQMYRLGSDIVARFENGQWLECGEDMFIAEIIGPIKPPSHEPKTRWVPGVILGTVKMQHNIDGEWKDVPPFWIK